MFGIDFSENLHRSPHIGFICRDAIERMRCRERERVSRNKCYDCTFSRSFHFTGTGKRKIKKWFRLFALTNNANFKRKTIAPTPCSNRYRSTSSFFFSFGLRCLTQSIFFCSFLASVFIIICLVWPGLGLGYVSLTIFCISKFTLRSSLFISTSTRTTLLSRSFSFPFFSVILFEENCLLGNVIHFRSYETL